MENIWYEIKNIKNRKNPAEYILIIVLNTKDAGIAIDERAQILLIYEHMNGHLRRDLPRPLSLSTLSGLIEDFRYQKNI